MTDQWNHGTGAADTQEPDSLRSRNDRWIRRPRRSTGDRKIAGVAGGLGRAFGVDPVLIRVAFVVLTIFGGFGGLLYVLGWLLLPADGDEVSAAEALLGRGRSSVPPALAVGLGAVAVIATFSTFSWGLPFLPLAIGGAIVLTIMRKRGRLRHRDWKQGYQWPADRGIDHQNDWTRRTDERVRRATEQAQQWAEQARFAGDQARRAGRAARWGASGYGPRGRGAWAGGQGWGAPTGGRSPFEQPAFWDEPVASTRVEGSSPRPADAVDLTKPSTPAPARDSARDPFDDQHDGPFARTTPPAWDPLGVAPFAWDLPEPTPLAPPSTAVSGRGGTIARVALGATLLVGAVTTTGVFAGWWALTWAQVSGLALGVLALGLLVSALRGRGYSLIGPGIFLSLVTMALAVTGVSGTNGYGVSTVTPTSLQQSTQYSANAGQLTVDLSKIRIPRGADKTVTVDLKGGHAVVIVPKSMNVNATCTAHVGHVDCLGRPDDGVRAEATNTGGPGADKSSTLNVTVEVNAGVAEVITGA